MENLISNINVLEQVKIVQDCESNRQNTHLKNDLDVYKELEMGIWYHLISPLDDKSKINEIFETIKSNLAKRCMNLGKELSI